MGQQMTAQNNSAAHLATVHLPQAGWEGHPSRLPAPRLAYGELGGAGCGVRPLSAAMRLEFSAAFSQKIFVFSSQASQTYCSYTRVPP